jgi:hypothetical protein
MEGQRKLLAAVVFGLLSLAALVVIILLKQFTPQVFTAWMTGTAGVFGLYMGANVVSKFAPEATPKQPDIVVTTTDAPKVPQERGGTGIFGISGKLSARKRPK